MRDFWGFLAQGSLADEEALEGAMDVVPLAPEPEMGTILVPAAVVGLPLPPKPAKKSKFGVGKEKKLVGKKSWEKLGIEGKNREKNLDFFGGNLGKIVPKNQIFEGKFCKNPPQKKKKSKFLRGNSAKISPQKIWIFRGKIREKSSRKSRFLEGKFGKNRPKILDF